ncbi:hypothetical protein ACFX14_003976 [Malus domestica]
MNLYYEVVIYERRNYLCVPRGHYAAWGEDLGLVFRLGEIIPSYGLRDMEQALGQELVISGYGRRDHRAGIGPGVILFSDLSSSTPRLRDDLRCVYYFDFCDVVPRYGFLRYFGMLGF